REPKECEVATEDLLIAGERVTTVAVIEHEGSVVDCHRASSNRCCLSCLFDGPPYENSSGQEAGDRREACWCSPIADARHPHRSRTRAALDHQRARCSRVVRAARSLDPSLCPDAGL